MSTKIGVDDWAAGTRATAEDLDGLPRVNVTPTLGPQARHGWVGRVVDSLDPYTEADPAAVALSTLAMVGNLIGDDPHACVGTERHPLRENVLLVGATGKGRKGTSWSAPRAILQSVDPAWAVRSGASSGEGLIYHVRDAREEQQAIKERGRTVGYERVIVDEGVTDKRLGLVETEFATVLRRMSSESNTLSAVIRQAWDTGNLSTLTKNSSLRATGAHISIIGHITAEELAASLHELDMANGFLNRFVVGLVKRSKYLPDGAVVPAPILDALTTELREIVAGARRIGFVQRDPDAAAMWSEIYADLSDGRDGLVGAILSRAEAHVLRLSTLYAVLDGSSLVRPVHLSAALAVWQYAEQSVKTIFGDRLGLPIADQILAALRQRPMSRDDLVNLFQRHRRAHEISQALDALLTKGLIRQRTEPTKGRPRTVYEVVP